MLGLFVRRRAIHDDDETVVAAILTMIHKALQRNDGGESGLKRAIYDGKDFKSSS